MPACLAFVLGALPFLPPPPSIALSPDWVAERPPPYPNLLASFRRGDATLTVGVQFLGEGEDAESFARGNAVALERMGFVVKRERDALHASRRGQDLSLRQVYVVRGTVGWVITLAGSPKDLRALAKDLAGVVRQLAETPN